MEYENPRIYVCQNPSILLRRIPTAQAWGRRLELELSLRKQVGAAPLVPGMGIPDSHFRSHHAYFRGRCLTEQYSKLEAHTVKVTGAGLRPGPLLYIHCQIVDMIYHT